MADGETGEPVVKIVARYDFNGGKGEVESRFAVELREIEQAIAAVDASLFKSKVSKEKTMPGRLLYAPSAINDEFRRIFQKKGWNNYRVECQYSFGEFLEGYTPPKTVAARPFRDMDFVKPGVGLGIEVQFGKYAFMVYNVCAKMTIFRNLGVIDAGVEIVPVKHFADMMSTGVSYFEQFA